MTRAAWFAATAAAPALVSAETISTLAAPSSRVLQASAPLSYKLADETALPTTPQWGLAVLLCAAALAAVFLSLRRRGQGLTWRRPSGVVQMVEMHALNANTQLAVVRYQGRQLLLSIGPANTQCLRDDPQPIEDQP